ncbi:M23 family metallopeptidase [Gordonia paraffinivorans]|uniref:M23 family metallopeptidase n=1 Tax=Gordonia paraffinivorans TaxID=175628 RepID=UPI003FCED477
MPPVVRHVLVVLVALVCVSSPTAGAQALRHSPPLPPKPVVVTGFDAPEKRWLPGHRGVDLAAAPGTPVTASGAGRVRFAGDVAGRGVVSIAHPDGIITTYEPVRASVARGGHVSRGEVIGTVVAGHPGCPAVACLHWGARRGSGREAAYLDPLGLLGAVRVRLLPVDGSRSPAADRRGDLTPVDGPADEPHEGVRR